MQLVTGIMRSAVERYDMIQDGDKIAVGVSGGKDSLVLLAGLSKLSRYYPKKFTVLAVTADPAMNGVQTDYSKVQEFCDSIGVEYIIKRTQIGKIVFEDRKEKNPCSLCARMRRGILHTISKENGCNKIALGHHMDDAIQTFMMNILESGKIGCFSPVTYLSRRDLFMIRPMIFCSEKQIASAARRCNLPIVKSTCPADGETHRKKTADLIQQLEHEYPDIKSKIIGAMERANISGWSDTDIKACNKELYY